MATFNTKKILYGSSALITEIANRIQEQFIYEGYEVKTDSLSSGGYDISITKGGIFKAVLGMKTALKITLIPQGNNVLFEAGVGIWGHQAIPTIISMLFFWPVLITQIWGMVEQAKLDDKALELAMEVVNSKQNISASAVNNDKKFCTQCGAQNTVSSKFCSECGAKL